jgi:hypothetical protein
MASGDRARESAKKMNKRLLGFVSILSGLLAPSVAHAQAAGQGPAWLDDRRVQEGAGVRTGNFELHPALGGEVGYDSNVLLRTHRVPASGSFINANPEGAFRIRVTPSLTLSTLGSQRREGRDASETPITFRASLSATYMEFFGTEIIQKQRNLSAAVRGEMTVLQGRPVGAVFSVGYSRFFNPSSIGNPDFAFTRNQLTGGAELVLTPGAGTLSYRFGYAFTANLFETSGATQYNNLMHTGSIRGQWRFTPRTSLLADTTVSYTTYTNLGPQPVLVDSTPIRSRLGIEGLLTPKIGILVMGGYGGSFFTSSQSTAPVRQFNSFVASARLTYYLSANPDSSDAQSQLSTFLSRVSLGYSRDFAPSVVSNYYGIDRGDLTFDAFFAGRAVVSLIGAVSAISYPDIPSTSAIAKNGILHPASTDIRPEITLFSEYRFSETFGLNATLRYTANISNIELLQVPSGTGNSSFDFNWRRIEAYIGARWFL